MYYIASRIRTRIVTGRCSKVFLHSLLLQSAVTLYEWLGKPATGQRKWRIRNSPTNPPRCSASATSWLLAVYLCTRILATAPLVRTYTATRMLKRTVRSLPLRRMSSTPPKPAEPVVTKVYGGMKDQDRIFTNLYGEFDWRLNAAMKRGMSSSYAWVSVYDRCGRRLAQNEGSNDYGSRLARAGGT